MIQMYRVGEYPQEKEVTPSATIRIEVANQGTAVAQDAFPWWKVIIGAVLVIVAVSLVIYAVGLIAKPAVAVAEVITDTAEAVEATAEVVEAVVSDVVVTAAKPFKPLIEWVVGVDTVTTSAAAGAEIATVTAAEAVEAATAAGATAAEVGLVEWADPVHNPITAFIMNIVKTIL